MRTKQRSERPRIDVRVVKVDNGTFAVTEDSVVMKTFAYKAEADFHAGEMRKWFRRNLRAGYCA